MTAYDILLKPSFLKKAMQYADKSTPPVIPGANKTQIKQAVEEIFKVKVEKVNTSNVTGKIKRMGRTQGRAASYKKAVVQLTADSKAIEFFESLA
jgi:large subunit ribosomal protein L23